MSTAAYTGKFLMLGREWKVVVNTGVPDFGDEIRVRKADKSVVTVIVQAVTGTWQGKAVCSTVQLRTESVYSQKHLAGVIYPATHPVDRAAAKRLANRLERAEGRDNYERKHQIGL